MQDVERDLDKLGILTLTFNRPDKLNALSEEILNTLDGYFHEAATDSMVKGILITGTGKAFCAGADIARLAACDAHSGEAFALEGQRVFRRLETLDKPSIAAVNGYAFGGGCELALAATLRIAATTAQFGQPEVKLGVIPGYGGTQRLARLVGKGRALDLCLTGRFITAELALQWGLVNAVVEPDQLITEAKRWMQGILNMAPRAVAAAMQVIHEGFEMPLPEALDLEAQRFARLCATEDKQEGVAAFLAKRPAVFRGN